ncbi:NAD(P)H-dependent flavin oxidoreductase [Maricaulis maris]|uniref:Propionate 3-nitronate monooxygenase n=1 Tax=Maricaulis maris TaxID=74318 RepID=A0A495CZL0_9PROT|nr:nitronate monooxygenase [Maricaulis maris]RKQ94200.1 nitronate monooxygenase [Maricaulis maris]
MPQTDIQQRIGLRHPIIQGPFGGGLSTVELAAAVTDAGGLGSFGAHYLEPDGIEALAARLRAATAGPVALNLWISDHDPGGDPFSSEAFDAVWQVYQPFFAEYGLERPEPQPRYHPRFTEQIDAVLEARPRVFSFVFGIPDRAVLEACRQRDIVTLGAATTLAEAEALDAAGVDLILATGFEAGGHRPAFLEPAEKNLIGTLPLTRQIASRIKRPVIAAGGIADRVGIEGAMALGAGAAQLGTAFLACAESGTNDAHRDVLFTDRARHTVLTRAYTGRLARGIPNRVIAEMDKRAGQLPPFPVQAWFLGHLKRAAIAAGDEDFASLYAGQGAPLLKHRRVSDLMADLTTPAVAPVAA